MRAILVEEKLWNYIRHLDILQRWQVTEDESKQDFALPFQICTVILRAILEKEKLWHYNRPDGQILYWDEDGYEIKDEVKQNCGYF